jgi:hypothetical protein
VKRARLDLVPEVFDYLLVHPAASANDVVRDLRVRRVDGLRAVRVVRELRRLPGGLHGWFLKPGSGIREAGR